MRRTSVCSVILGTALAVAAFSNVLAQGRSANDGVYTAEQAKRGEMVYTDMCAACHDPMLIGGVGPALTGKDFFTAWKEMSVGDLFTKIKTEMPLTAPGTLTPDQAADVVSYILSFNKFPAGSTALGTDPAPLKEVKITEPKSASRGTVPSGGLSADARAFLPGASHEVSKTVALGGSAHR